MVLEKKLICFDTLLAIVMIQPTDISSGNSDCMLCPISQMPSKEYSDLHDFHVSNGRSKVDGRVQPLQAIERRSIITILYRIFPFSHT